MLWSFTVLARQRTSGGPALLVLTRKMAVLEEEYTEKNLLCSAFSKRKQLIGQLRERLKVRSLLEAYKSLGGR